MTIALPSGACLNASIRRISTRENAYPACSNTRQQDRRQKCHRCSERLSKQHLLAAPNACLASIIQPLLVSFPTDVCAQLPLPTSGSAQSSAPATFRCMRWLPVQPKHNTAIQLNTTRARLNPHLKAVINTECCLAAHLCTRGSSWISLLISSVRQLLLPPAICCSSSPQPVVESFLQKRRCSSAVQVFQLLKANRCSPRQSTTGQSGRLWALNHTWVHSCGKRTCCGISTVMHTVNAPAPVSIKVDAARHGGAMLKATAVPCCVRTEARQ